MTQGNYDGVGVFGSPGTVVSNNVIAGNRHSGLVLNLTGANTITGNKIGVKADGTAAGNTYQGLHCVGSIPSASARVGGAGTGEPNTIAYNGRGVYVDAACNGVALLRNSVFGNVELGINLCNGPGPACDGVTPNDDGDGDAGGNELTNYPTDLAVTNDGTNARITFTLKALPNQGYHVEVFTNISIGLDPSGYGEGQEFQFDAAVTAGADGRVTLTVEKPAWQFPVGHWVTATATPLMASQEYGGTSEFSRAVEVTASMAAAPLAEVSAEAEALPAVLALHPPAPNPSAGRAALHYDLPVASHVRLAVYDVLGREAAVVVDGDMGAGRHTVRVDGSVLPSGTYVVRLVAGGHTLTRRMTLLR